jgi:hypothetical protein
MSLAEAESQTVHLEFEGFTVALHARSEDLRKRIKADFSFFLSTASTTPDLEITAELAPQPVELTPAHLEAQGIHGRRSRNCVMYDLGQSRINDYSGEAVVEFDFANSKAQIYSENLHRLHEITYLLILSRSGKAMDLAGLHRLHAMAVKIGELCVTCAMPMGMGKSTLLLELLRDVSIGVISDDSPLVTGTGKIRRFPVRFGIKPGQLDQWVSHPNLRLEEAYELDRMRYGKKLLLPLSAVRNPVCSTDSSRVILITGTRSALPGCEIREVSGFRSLPILFTDLVIGVGLPMMREYFIEPGWRDFAIVTGIFFRRLGAALRLALRARHLRIRLGPKPEMNARTLKTFLEDPTLASAQKTAYSQSRE